MVAVENSRAGARAGEPFGREALAFSRERLMQRSVEVRVVDMDKNGVALGSLFTGSGSQKRNYAADILKVREFLPDCKAFFCSHEILARALI